VKNVALFSMKLVGQNLFLLLLLFAYNRSNFAQSVRQYSDMNSPPSQQQMSPMHQAAYITTLFTLLEMVLQIIISQ